MVTWQEDDGDNTRALDWPLDENSTVWEIGGFAGRWAAQMWEKYHCNITVFEPQLWAVDILREKFGDNPKINIEPHGLWIVDANLRIGDYYTDGASVLKKHVREEGWGNFKSVSREVAGSVNDIDLALMNVEGSEYYLIPEMIYASAMTRIRYFWCQFHPPLITDGEKRFEMISAGLEKTHNILWSYYPTAVAWERKLP